jgi:hypothetical protein
MLPSLAAQQYSAGRTAYQSALMWQRLAHTNMHRAYRQLHRVSVLLRQSTERLLRTKQLLRH